MVFGLMIAGAAPDRPGALLVGRAVGCTRRGAGLVGAGFGAGAASRTGAAGFGTVRLLRGAVPGRAAAGTVVGELPISNGGR